MAESRADIFGGDSKEEWWVFSLRFQLILIVAAPPLLSLMQPVKMSAVKEASGRSYPPIQATTAQHEHHGELYLLMSEYVLIFNNQSLGV